MFFSRYIAKTVEKILLDPDNVQVRDELLPCVRQVRQLRQEARAEIEELRNRADTIAAITENMREGLILLDENGAVLIANKSAGRIFGEIRGTNILHVCRDASFQEGVRRCLAGESAGSPLDRGGRTYSVHFSPAPREVRGAVVLLFDVTERHKAERQRREFTANVSHELKTPLTSILALSEMIAKGMAKEEDIQVFAAKISHQSKRLIDMIEDIIRLSEFDEDKVGREEETFDLYTLAESVVDVFLENDKGVEIQLSGQRFEISANSRMIDEMLYNLIENGVKYNRDGGIVRVALSKEDGMCKIAVSDTGIGIPPEHHGRVFERFYRVDKSRSKKTGGTGLGLSIVKHITEHHGGGITLESIPGQGTTVAISIPVTDKGVQ